MMAEPQAGTIVDYEKLCAAYELTTDDFITLSRHPVFEKMFAEARQRIKDIGPTASHRYRMEMLSADLAEDLYAQAKKGQMEGKDKIKLLQVFLNSAGLAEPEEKQFAGGNNVQVNFQLPSIPGRDFNKILEGTVEDAEYKEVNNGG